MNVRVQLRLCSPGTGTRWPLSFLQVCEVPAVKVDEQIKKIRKEMKAEFVVDNAGGLHHLPVSQTPPERMTKDRRRSIVSPAQLVGSFIARWFTAEPMALDKRDVPKMSRYDAGV